MDPKFAEAVAALQRVYLFVTGCSPGEFSTYTEMGQEIIDKLKERQDAEENASN